MSDTHESQIGLKLLAVRWGKKNKLGILWELVRSGVVHTQNSALLSYLTVLLCLSVRAEDVGNVLKVVFGFGIPFLSSSYQQLRMRGTLR